MQGLLDFLKTPEGQGLLGATFAGMAGARRNQPWNTAGAAGLGGLLAYNQGVGNQTNQALKDMQVAEAQRKQSQIQKQQDLLARMNPSLRVSQDGNIQTDGNGSQIKQPSQAEKNLWEMAMTGVIPFEEYAQRSGAVPGKVARSVEVGDGKGGKRTIMVDEYGREVSGFDGYVAPVQVNRGDRIEFALPTPGASFGVNMSQAERVAAGQRQQGLDIQRHQLELGKTQILNDPNQGPILVNKVTGVSAPVLGVDGSPVLSEAAAKQVSGSKKALSIIDQAETLIDSATGSYIGAGVDQAYRAFGGTTKGSEATAKLKALEGSLMMAQPRMEGPQSNMDVQLYRQMAGQIGDPTVPASMKKAALTTIRQLHERYSGAQPATNSASNNSGASVSNW